MASKRRPEHSLFSSDSQWQEKKNTIHSLDDGEKVIEGTKNLLGHATTFYKDLFGPARGNLFHMSPDTWASSEKLTTDDNEMLTKLLLRRKLERPCLVWKAIDHQALIVSQQNFISIAGTLLKKTS